MLRNIALTLLLSPLFIASCAKKEETPSTPPCQYVSQAARELKLSTIPHQMNIPLRQEKLVPLLWTSIDQGECFLQKNGSVKLFIVEDHPKSRPEVFFKLKKAPQKSIENWHNNEASIGTTLMGLTTFRFYEKPQEKIVETIVLLRDNARAWHLWHEYAHYLIGQSRVDSPTESLFVHSSDDVEEAFKKVWSQTNNQESFLQSFQNYSSLQKDYFQKKYLDEIVIELTLQELASQARSTLPLASFDFITSDQVVSYFYQKYSNEISRALQDLRGLQENVPDLWSDVIESQIRFLENQKKSLRQIIFG